MNSRFLARYSPSLLSTFVALLPLCSFSAHATPINFSLVEFSMAFVLGLSVVAVLILALTHSLGQIKGKLFVLLTASCLVMLYALAYLTSEQLLILLSFSLLFLTLLYYSALYAGSQLSIKANQIRTVLVGIGSLTYLVVLWFLPQVDAFSTWAMISAFILLIWVSHFSLRLFSSPAAILWWSCQWLLGASFSGLMYLWLYNQIATTWLVANVMLCFVMAIIQLCFYIVRDLQTKDVETIEIPTATIDEHILYPRDPSTNLPTYQKAVAHVEQVLKLEKNRRYVAIVFKPINFQQVNTVLGHQNSDILLLQLAYSLQKYIEDKDGLVNFNTQLTPIKMARLQGLHFLVVLDLSISRHPERSVVNELCQQLQQAVPEAMSFKSFSLNFELAFGVAFINEHGNNITEVIAHAEDALLEAEKNNIAINYFDNEAVLYTEQHLLKMERLKQDIIEENLRWFIQPQVQLSSREIVGFELMVHWYNQEKPLELHQFIKTAEHSGELYLLTKQMIKQAFITLRKLQSLNINCPLSIKLLSPEILESDLVDYIEKQLDAYEVAGKYLIIELTESVVLKASARAKNIIDQLKLLDVNIAIGDFSGSYESLRYLRKMAISQIKIDCHHLVDSIGNISDKAIVNALINLTRAMKIPLVGTGIDSVSIEKLFTAMGGNLAQGRLINVGVVYEELEIWVDEWRKLHPNVRV